MWEITPEISASVHEYVRSNQHDLLWMFHGKNRLRVNRHPAYSLLLRNRTAPADVHFFQCGAIFGSTLTGIVGPRIWAPASTIAAISLCLSSSARSAGTSKTISSCTGIMSAA